MQYAQASTIYSSNQEDTSRSVSRQVEQSICNVSGKTEKRPTIINCLTFFLSSNQKVFLLAGRQE